MHKSQTDKSMDSKTATQTTTVNRLEYESLPAEAAMLWQIVDEHDT